MKGPRRYWLETDLPPGPHDQREVLLYASMATLDSYVRASGGEEGILQHNDDLLNSPLSGGDDPAVIDHCKRQAEVQAELISIWKWWVEDRPKKVRELDEEVDLKRAIVIEQELLDQEQDALLRLVRHRLHLWV